MSKGENIFKRKDGRWEARYIRARDISGKIIYGFCYGRTYREAKEKVIKCKTEVCGGGVPQKAHEQPPFSFYCGEWLRLRAPKIRESTYIKYESVLKKHIEPHLGGFKPCEITTEIITEFTDTLSFAEGLSPKSVHDILVILHGIIKYSSAEFPDTFNKTEINYPKKERKEMRVLSPAEQKLFVDYLLTNTDPCKFGLLLALFTGIRIGELCALKWDNISLNDKTVRIDSTMQRLRDTDCRNENKTKVIIGRPKSDTSARTIPMTENLTNLCRQMLPDSGSAYVLTGTADYMEPRALQYRVGKYTRDCGLSGVHCHTLRHTFATRAVEVGFEIKSLSEILGHANTAITLERYVHSSMELKRANMNKLAAAGF